MSWTVRSITGSASVVADMCLSSNGAIMFAGVSGVLGGSTDNGNGGIYRSFDYGANWTRVRNQIASGSYFFGIIKCDTTGRFLVACDRSEAQPTGGGQIQTSDDFGSGWTWFGDELARGGTAAYVSPGGNLMITLHNETYNSRIRYTQDYGRSWTNAIDYNSVIGGGSARLISIAANYDGTVILTSDNISTSRVHRCIEERGRLAAAVGSRDLTITPAFGGGYTLLNNPVETLWTSSISVFNTHNPSFPLGSFGSIDLDLYNIRYEIECYWYVGDAPYAYIQLSLNGFTATDTGSSNQTDPNTAVTGSIGSLTNWTNIINNGTTIDSNNTEFNQCFRNRFYCGYSPIVGSTDSFRYRTIIKGTLSLLNPAIQAGITDHSTAERNIYNQFSCENYTSTFPTSQFHFLFGDTLQNLVSNHQRLIGTSIYAAESLWTTAGYNAGINQIGLKFIEGSNLTTRTRNAQYRIRFYRVRK